MRPASPRAGCFARSETDAKFDAWLERQQPTGPRRAAPAARRAPPPRAQLPDADGSPAVRTDAAAVSLLRWAAVAKLETAPGLALATFGGGLDGVAATAPVDGGALLVRLPRAAALVVREADGDGGAGDEADGGAQPWWARLAVRLVAEARRGAASPLAAYIDALPREFDTLLHWTAAELDELQDPKFATAVERQRAGLARAHAAVVASGAVGGPPVSLEEFTWAAECVLSRAFGADVSGDRRVVAAAVAAVVAGAAGGSEISLLAGLVVCAALLGSQLYAAASGAGASYVMAPLIDSMNHDGWSRSSCGYSPLYDAFEVRAAADGAAEGSQLFITYGDAKGNDALLQYYGFVEAGNRADRAWLESAALGLDRATGGSEEGLVAVGGASASSRPPPPPRSSRDAAATRRRQRRRSRRRAPTGSRRCPPRSPTTRPRSRAAARRCRRGGASLCSGASRRRGSSPE